MMRITSSSEFLWKRGKKSYLCEKVMGEIILPTRAAFIDGLAPSKVSVCFPCNVTHPQRCGDTETMTQRYLQSMASKCLIIGHAPAEMTALFGLQPGGRSGHG